MLNKKRENPFARQKLNTFNDKLPTYTIAVVLKAFQNHRPWYKLCFFPTQIKSFILFWNFYDYGFSDIPEMDMIMRIITVVRILLGTRCSVVMEGRPVEYQYEQEETLFTSQNGCSAL